MAQLIDLKKKTSKRIKNLRWLLEHKRDITKLTWLDVSSIADNEGLLIANIGEDKTYLTEYASKEAFLSGRSFRHFDVEFK